MSFKIQNEVYGSTIKFSSKASALNYLIGIWQSAKIPKTLSDLPLNSKWRNDVLLTFEEETRINKASPSKKRAPEALDEALVEKFKTFAVPSLKSVGFIFFHITDSIDTIIARTLYFLCIYDSFY
eukprot:TRINITY_DN470_c0_g1_i2.p1 TRINITY_DN470_c0_g1~~TRINITY_DN470_c0_g1_i2.p1  ORF type:complete len:125 (-),score=11.60 TRINITY_DN470_c0_g1_i2:85-459(-)